MSTAVEFLSLVKYRLLTDAVSFVPHRKETRGCLTLLLNLRNVLTVLLQSSEQKYSDYQGLGNIKLACKSMTAVARVQIQHVGFCKMKIRMQEEASSSERNAPS